MHSTSLMGLAALQALALLLLLLLLLLLPLSLKLCPGVFQHGGMEEPACAGDEL